MLMRGTAKHTRQQIQDERRLKAPGVCWRIVDNLGLDRGDAENLGPASRWPPRSRGSPRLADRVRRAREARNSAASRIRGDRAPEGLHAPRKPSPRAHKGGPATASRAPTGRWRLEKAVPFHERRQEGVAFLRRVIPRSYRKRLQTESWLVGGTSFRRFGAAPLRQARGRLQGSSRHQRKIEAPDKEARVSTGPGLPPDDDPDYPRLVLGELHSRRGF
jgi:hypothetical protein